MVEKKEKLNSKIEQVKFDLGESYQVSYNQKEKELYELLNIILKKLNLSGFDEDFIKN